MRILLAAADPTVRDAAAAALRREGLYVLTAACGEDALHRWKGDHPDLLILDGGLRGPGGLDGFEVCRRVRQRADLPIILLSDRSDDEHVVRGFRLGADDYVGTNVSPRELALRVHAVWRRHRAGDTGHAGAVPAGRWAREVAAGALVLDAETYEVRCVGREADEASSARPVRPVRPVRLTPTEFRLLHILAQNAGRVVGSARLVEYAWGDDVQEVRLLKAHVCHLRRKLDLPRGRAGDIESVPRVGYRLTL
jgi:DNA-binding response OmpR family regulator